MAKLYLPLDFKEFLQLLNEHQVEYIKAKKLHAGLKI